MRCEPLGVTIMRSRDPQPGRDERLDYNGHEASEEDSRCRGCKRVMIEHPSHACRACRRGKPDGWMFGQEIKVEDNEDENADEFEP